VRETRHECEEGGIVGLVGGGWAGRLWRPLFPAMKLIVTIGTNSSRHNTVWGFGSIMFNSVLAQYDAPKNYSGFLINI